MGQENNSLATQYRKYEVYFKPLRNQEGPFMWYGGAKTLWAMSESDAKHQMRNIGKNWFGTEVEIVRIVSL